MRSKIGLKYSYLQTDDLVSYAVHASMAEVAEVMSEENGHSGSHQWETQAWDHDSSARTPQQWQIYHSEDLGRTGAVPRKWPQGQLYNFVYFSNGSATRKL